MWFNLDKTTCIGFVYQSKLTYVVKTREEKVQTSTTLVVYILYLHTWLDKKVCNM